MDFQISTSALSGALAQVADIADDKKSTMPILACVLISTEKTPEGGRLHIQAYDLEMGAATAHSCEIKTAGSIAVPAKKLLEVVKVLPSHVARIKVAGNNRVEITSGEASFRLAALPADDFPALPAVEETEYLPTAVLQKALAKVAFAMSSDETRYMLNGVYLDLPAGKAVATDGHRMCMADLDKVDAPAVIISKKTVAKLRKLLATEGESRGEFAVNESSLLYRRAGMRLVSRLVDGQFPAYQQVMPERVKEPVLVDRAKLKEALGRVMLMAADTASAVQLAFEDEALTLTTKNPETGDASDVVGTCGVDKPVKLHINGHYLMDMLGVADSKQVELHLGDEMSPVLVAPEGDTSHTYVLMPMRG